MRKTLTLLSCTLLFGTMAFAQRGHQERSTVQGTVKTLMPAAAAQRTSAMCTDTLSHIGATDTLTLYNDRSSTGAFGGYVAGNNRYGDKAKVNRFRNNGPATVSGAIMFFGRAVATTANATATIGVWNAGTNGSPGMMAGSMTVQVSDIAANVAAQQPTMVTFTTPVNVTGNYYIGVVLPTGIGDTLALYTNRDGNTGPDLAWEQFSDNTWHPYSDATNSWGINVANAIFPIMTSDITAGFTSSAMSVAVNTPVTFTNTSTGGFMDMWTFQDGTPATSTDASPSVTFATSGTKTVTLMRMNEAGNCMNMSTSTITVTGGVGRPEMFDNANVKVYPNPASRELTIDAADVKVSEIRLVNALGQTVLKTRTVSSQQRLDVSSLSRGLYFVQLVTKEGTITRMLTLQN